MKKYFVKSIDLYQRYISPLKKPSCVFYPTCSNYAKEAFEKYGVIKGAYLSARRVLRCHPWQKKHMDPLP
ncbi:MAG: membrane protein insertion efficiency factor YidD [bacterium]